MNCRRRIFLDLFLIIHSMLGSIHGISVNGYVKKVRLRGSLYARNFQLLNALFNFLKFIVIKKSYPLLSV